jgi:2-keto-3-deoxy-6-phosphogluconate aldolase
MTRTHVLEAIERGRCIAIVRGLDTDRALACAAALAKRFLDAVPRRGGAA